MRYSHPMIRSGLILLALLQLTMVQANAQTRLTSEDDKIDLWRICPATGLLPILESPQQRPTNNQIILNADVIESEGSSVSRLSGNVTITSEKEDIRADDAVYSVNEQKLELQGNVHYRSDQFEFNADSMTRFTNSEKSEINDLEFFIPLNHANGTAKHVSRVDENITTLQDMTYTTCQPGDRIWYFNAREMKLDHAEGMGFAKHMTLRFRNIPVMYFPALSFPIDDHRKSGFLFPGFGNSSRHGAEFYIPYYWNIAPQADATFTPHYLHKRGTKLDSEWRYLTSWSQNRLDYQTLDDDVYGERRSLLALQHSGKMGEHWATLINATEVSDRDYMRDFSEELSGTSITHLAKNAVLTGQWNNWRFTTRLLSYQTVDSNIASQDDPYSLKPEMDLSGFYPDIGLGIEFVTENTYTLFDRGGDASSDRLDFWSRFSRPFGNSGWFITPAISGRFTSYNPENLNQTGVTNTIVTRSIPTASLDSGLIFEKSAGENDKFIKTFEPRVFYLNTPLRNQNDIPVFDTREPAFGMYLLYAENRFAGIDRIGDADQASLSFTNRWINSGNGEEQFRISLGQIFFFQDREVTLPQQPPDTREQSGILTELDTRFGKYWSSSLNVEWNPDSGQTDQTLFRLRYNRQARYVFNLGYRYRRADNIVNNENLKQADLSFNLPAGENWSIMGKWSRSVEDKTDLDKYLGFEYESCCWAIRVLAREYLLGRDLSGNPEIENSVSLEFIFKGLSRTGGNIGRRLEQNITGYQEPFE